MAYALRYYVNFNSAIYSKDIRVEFYKKDFTGDAVKLACTSEIALTYNDEKYIKTSILTICLQSDAEGALREFYTTDNKLFKVVLKINNTVTWQGYVLPELYSEQYIDSPYPVTVTASDQLAILKDIDYTAQEQRVSLLQIIKKCLAHTNLGLDFDIKNQIKYGQMTATETIFQVIKLDESYYQGKSVYEVLESILRTLNTTIKQVDNRWVLLKETDVEGASVQVDNSLLSAQEQTKAAISQVFGSARNKGIDYPVGSLSYTIVPAKKSLQTKLQLQAKASFFKNADCEKDTDWTVSSESGVLKPGKKEVSIYTRDGNPITLRPETNYYTLKPIEVGDGGNTDYNYMQQEVDIEAEVAEDGSDKFSVEVKYAQDVARDFRIEIKNYNDENIKYLSLDGWGDDEKYINVNIDSNVAKESNGVVDKASFSSTKFTFYSLPLTGKLSIKITHPARKHHSGIIQPVGGYGEDKLYIGGVYLKRENVIENVIASNTLIEGASEKADDVALDFGDATVAKNIDKVFLNYLTDKNGAATATSWAYKTITQRSLIALMHNDYAQLYGRKTERLSGILIYRGAIMPDFYTDKFSGKKFIIKKAVYNLYTDEVEVVLDSVYTYTSLYEPEYTSSADKGGSSSQGGGSSSSSSGPTSSAGEYVKDTISVNTIKLGEALLSWDAERNAIRASEVLYSIKNLTVLGEGEDVPGGGGASCNRLDTWDGYDNSTMAGYVLSAGLGYDINTRLKALEKSGGGGGGSIADSLLTSWGDYSPSKENTYALSAGLGYQLYEKAHTHSNKSVLDTITLTMIDKWNRGYLPTTTKYALSDVVGGDALLAKKLTWSRKISLSGAVRSNGEYFDGSSDISISVNYIYDDFIQNDFVARNNNQLNSLTKLWINQFRANQIAFINPDAITIQYSRDGGGTWANYRPRTTNDEIYLDNLFKKRFVSGINTNLSDFYVLGKDNIKNAASNNNQLRIEIDTYKAKLDCNIEFIIPYVGDMANSLYLTIDKRHTTTGAWTNIVNKIQIKGAPGYNKINIPNGGIRTDLFNQGNGTTDSWHTRFIRFTFTQALGTTLYGDSYVYNLFSFGSTYTATSIQGKTGMLYDYDEDQNMKLPAGIYANQINFGNGCYIIADGDKLKVHGTIYSDSNVAVKVKTE